MTSAGAPAAWLSLQTFNAALSPPAGRTAGLGRAVNASNPTHPWCARPVDVAAIQPLTAERAETWKLIAAGMSGLTTILRPDDGGSASERSLRRHIFNRSKTVLHLEGEGFRAAALAMGWTTSRPPVRRSSASRFRTIPSCTRA